MDLPAEPPPPAEHNREILVELDRLQSQRAGGWGRALLILAVSIGLFIAAGATLWSWKMALMLVPIIFFHEMGHYLAMQAFGYRNVRMFFIPFFGAAVAGQHFNVPGWKKAAVALAGPLPGIALGAVLGVTALALGQPLLMQAALMMLFLNGLNLLPFLPFDGGWVMHAVLFSRHPALDGAFRLLAVLALGLGGALLGDIVLMVLAGLMLIALPMAFRTARIAADLQRRGLPPLAPDAQRIPEETAQLIIEEINAGARAPLPPRLVAQQTLQIFETVNSKPPGVLASLVLLILHGGGLVSSIIFAVVLIFLSMDRLDWPPRPEWKEEEEVEAQDNSLTDRRRFDIIEARHY